MKSTVEQPAGTVRSLFRLTVSNYVVVKASILFDESCNKRNNSFVETLVGCQ